MRQGSPGTQTNQTIHLLLYQNILLNIEKTFFRGAQQLLTHWLLLTAIAINNAFQQGGLGDGLVEPNPQYQAHKLIVLTN